MRLPSSAVLFPFLVLYPLICICRPLPTRVYADPLQSRSIGGSAAEESREYDSLSQYTARNLGDWLQREISRRGRLSEEFVALLQRTDTPTEDATKEKEEMRKIVPHIPDIVGSSHEAARVARKQKQAAVAAAPARGSPNDPWAGDIQDYATAAAQHVSLSQTPHSGDPLESDDEMSTFQGGEKEHDIGKGASNGQHYAAAAALHLPQTPPRSRKPLPLASDDEMESFQGNGVEGKIGKGRGRGRTGTASGTKS